MVDGGRPPDVVTAISGLNQLKSHGLRMAAAQCGDRPASGRRKVPATALIA
jgi:hypothetical protein